MGARAMNCCISIPSQIKLRVAAAGRAAAGGPHSRWYSLHRMFCSSDYRNQCRQKNSLENSRMRVAAAAPVAICKLIYLRL
jgi:thiaminase